MKSIITTLSFFVCVSIFAQFDASIAITTGYENNINKAPKSYKVNDVLKTAKELYQSSIYQEGIVNLKYKDKTRNSRFRAYLTPEIRYYFSEQNSNRFMLKTGLSYTYVFNENYKWETAVKYRLKDQKGEDLDEAELSTPLGYNTLTFTTGLHTRLYENNRTLIRASYDIKNFDASTTRDISYNRYGMYIKFQNLYKADNKIHKLGFTSSFYSRNYTLDYTKSNKVKNRTWNYFNVDAFYSLPITEKMNLVPALNYNTRADVTNKKYGYSQIVPSLALRYKGDKFETKFATSYTARGFEALKASTSDVKDYEDLNYKYVKLTLKGSYKLNEDLYITTDNYLFNRTTNNTNVNTKAYRSYNKYYLGVGAKYNF